MFRQVITSAFGSQRLRTVETKQDDWKQPEAYQTIDRHYTIIHCWDTRADIFEKPDGLYYANPLDKTYPKHNTSLHSCSNRMKYFITAKSFQILKRKIFGYSVPLGSYGMDSMI